MQYVGARYIELIKLNLSPLSKLRILCDALAQNSKLNKQEKTSQLVY